jgi:hypothetical protein
MFKTKNASKKRDIYDSRVTLDAKHNEKIEYFNTKYNSVTHKRYDLETINTKLESFHTKSNSELTSEELENKLLLQEDKKKLENELDNIKDKTEDIDYFLDTGKLLFNYYDISNNISEGKELKKNNIKKLQINTNSKSVMEYFQHNKEPKSQPKNVEISVTSEDLDVSKSSPRSEPHQSKARLYEEYLSKVDNHIIKEECDYKIEVCDKCHSEKILFISEGKLICTKCGDESSILIDSDKPSYKDPPREVCYFAYKRINHFNEWLAQFQAKESTDIPQDVYNEILVELKKERLTNMNELTTSKLREILKKLKKNKYYEHIPHIINKLNGIPPPVMSRETEEELRRMFKEIQVPFHKFCPENRKNFLSYSYVLHKFVQLLELDEFLPCFMLLKSREKLHQQDKIWKDICKYLNWQFIPSI